MNSSAELTEASLAAIAEHNPTTNAFILVDAEGARRAAKQADDEKRRGIDRGPLHGMPISIKDLIDIEGQPTTAASKVRANHVAERDAPVITRLREAGAVLIGKTNLHEFALGTTSEESAYGPVRNPRDPSRSAGGSSGGSAAAVALGMGLASIGSDTGGSIRIPAAACGVVGLKPTIGEVPTDGVVSLSTTFDHVGPITRTVSDAAAIWAVLSGRRPAPLEARTAGSLTLGVLGDYFTDLLDADVRAAFADGVARLREAGATLHTRAIPRTSEIMDTYVAISLAEAAHWHAPTLEAGASDYQPPVRDRLLRGRAVLAVDYLRARETREAYRRAVDDALENHDALILPTLPIVAPPLGAGEVAMDNGEKLVVRSAMLRLTQLFNITGHPAISIPLSGSGMPAGLQLVGHRNGSLNLCEVASACSFSTDVGNS